MVDLVLKQNNGHTLYEFKTELRDIGKTIRQVKNQAEYYPKDKEVEVSSSNLVLYNKRKNREILSKNKNLFEDIEVILYVPTLQLSGRAFSDRGEFHLESFFRKLGFIKSYNVPSEKNYFFGTDFYSDRGTLEKGEKFVSSPSEL
ncbi:hypothetical protein AKJ41_06450 [candidate division MSBL1 archaeon SCGC-AAA259O05]|uniref:Uncharacterized protein n=1 Tax=candidate division MSBL1 archaeon SCGC-AAA259O05 TaxID=1698271 RepID=A0A133UWN3_9EURY|nr:hypothetical protein AKJ41_06450 [candidate division MSBL1 archaeon SCGC-AAA259O05]